MSNRLAGSSSPYLRQHQDNPVDWYEWSPEAFARAKSEDKPIFLSIGYSSCHWCHVMAHECFEDDEVAAILNEFFVCIKLDREERPDIDDVYMTAIQLISGRGGWPLSVFLTPDKKPFFAGTYFPKQDRGQQPGFMSLLKQLITAWKTQRQQVIASADQVATAVEQARSRTLSSLTSTIQPSLFKECFQSLYSSFDKEFGGFGEAPKFPPHTSLAFLIEYAIFDRENAGKAFEMVVRTLASMALGGIHDQVGGGFHRYSTDAEWRLPHFEKMLWDNALLLEQYVNAAAILEGSNPDIADLFVRTAMGIVDFVKSNLTSTSGLFYSALDADSEGEEGTYYSWTESEIRQRLGSTADEFIAAFQIEEDGNYLDEATRKKNGRNLLLLNPEYAGRFQSELAELLAIRSERPSPGLDDKCVAAANGIMIKALALAGETMLAERCAINWVEAYQTLGELPHQISGGRPVGDAFLDDYGCMIQGLTHLAAATDKPAYSALAEDLALQMIGRFGDSEKKGFYYTPIEAETLMGRHKPALDQSGPSANALAIQALIQLAMVDEAREHLMAVVGWAQKAPQAAEALVHAALQLELQALMQESATGDIAAIPVETPPKSAPLPKVTAKLETVEIRAVNGVGSSCVVVTIPEELHLNTSNPPARWLIPTQLTANGIRITVEYPPGENDQYSGILKLPFSTEKCSSSTEFELRLSFQACTDRECLAADEIVLDGVVIV